jgi:uncharacterized protein
MQNRVVHFEIHASDPERAQKFYGEVFGWSFPKWLEQPPYWGAVSSSDGTADPGINGGLMFRHGDPAASGAPVNAFVCTIQVDEYDETHTKIIAAGGTVALPKQAIPGMAWQGYYTDTEGNIFGVHQADDQAR